MCWSSLTAHRENLWLLLFYRYHREIDNCSKGNPKLKEELHMWKRFLIELGTGADLHGMDVMEAATRAVRDAVSHCCMCGLVETLGVQDLKKEMRIKLKIAAPEPEGIDVEALKKLLIADDVEVEVVQGGMLVNGLHVDEFGKGDQIMVVNAGITVYFRT